MAGPDPKAPAKPRPTSDPVPDSVVRAALDALANASGTELAVLVFDSLVDEDDAASDHVLRFDHPEVAVELRVASTYENVRVQGAVARSTSTRAELHTFGIDIDHIVDASDGSFLFPSIPHGLVRLVITRREGPDVATDWFRV